MQKYEHLWYNKGNKEKVGGVVMSRKSHYMITFEFLEEQLFGVVKEREHTIKALKGEVSPENMKCSLSAYTRRLNWIDRIVKGIAEIHGDVNEKTQKIIELLYVQGKSFDYVEKELGISTKRLIRQHSLIVDEMMEMLGMDWDRKAKHEKSYRAIPVSVKREVFERDEGKCTVCGSDKELHYHHIKRFADGGTHSAYNLTLLCVSCHAEEHKGEQSYHMLRKNAERVDIK